MTEKLIFGKHTPKDAEDLWNKIKPRNPNPCVALYGEMPGQTCKGCKYLIGWAHSRVYYKCQLRKITHGAGTDHRVNWPACGKYEKKI